MKKIVQSVLCLIMCLLASCATARDRGTVIGKRTRAAEPEYYRLGDVYVLEVERTAPNGKRIFKNVMVSKNVWNSYEIGDTYGAAKPEPTPEPSEHGSRKKARSERTAEKKEGSGIFLDYLPKLFHKKPKPEPEPGAARAAKVETRKAMAASAPKPVPAKEAAVPKPSPSPAAAPMKPMARPLPDATPAPAKPLATTAPSIPKPTATPRAASTPLPPPPKSTPAPPPPASPKPSPALSPKPVPTLSPTPSPKPMASMAPAPSATPQPSATPRSSATPIIPPHFAPVPAAAIKTPPPAPVPAPPLKPEERAALDKARSQAIEDAHVREMKGKIHDARSDEAQRKASQDYQKALYARMRVLAPAALKPRIDAEENEALKKLP